MQRHYVMVSKSSISQKFTNQKSPQLENRDSNVYGIDFFGVASLFIWPNGELKSQC